MKKYAISAWIVLAMTLSGGSIAAAKSISSAADGSLDVSGVVDTNLGTGIKSVVNAILGVPANTGVSSEVEVSVQGDVAASAGNTSSDADTQLGVTSNVIVVTRADVEGGAAAATDASPLSVTTDADLTGFVAAQIVADENVSKIETSADSVSVTHKQNAKLFGLIPVTVDVTVSVSADGDVEVTYPWYAFLMVTNESDLETKIQGRVDTIASGNAAASADAALAASTQAKLVSEITTVLGSELSAQSEWVLK